jgi:hypothetical protein
MTGRRNPAFVPSVLQPEATMKTSRHSRYGIVLALPAGALVAGCEIAEDVEGKTPNTKSCGT